ncbi:hypothetical protein PtA15_4A783 [Puccinia triticina]|uniref:Uncharacterized protein n=1 Tax=Puccinia triticina TaxID=208348 RepID=A0ABY7CHU5_9BASI|nr:uncharacterized protein PtA15_4A783 [Puccinia triticina]WAQ84330.1 hypothetical protein PtA15_4A783 [Puccinia triticina]
MCWLLNSQIILPKPVQAGIATAAGLASVLLSVHRPTRPLRQVACSLTVLFNMPGSGPSPPETALTTPIGPEMLMSSPTRGPTSPSPSSSSPSLDGMGMSATSGSQLWDLGFITQALVGVGLASPQPRTRLSEPSSGSTSDLEEPQAK